MTQTELNNLIIKLKCCFADKAYLLSNNLSIGGCDNYKELSILEDYIQELQEYELVNTDDNCLDNDQFEDIVENARNICDLCDC